MKDKVKILKLNAKFEAVTATPIHAGSYPLQLDKP
jgi:hypothetical protein